MDNLIPNPTPVSVNPSDTKRCISHKDYHKILDWKTFAWCSFNPPPPPISSLRKCTHVCRHYSAHSGWGLDSWKPSVWIFKALIFPKTSLCNSSITDVYIYKNCHLKLTSRSRYKFISWCQPISLHCCQVMY